MGAERVEHTLVVDETLLFCLNSLLVIPRFQQKSICVQQPILFIVLKRQCRGKWPQDNLSVFIIWQLFVLVVCESLEEHNVGLTEGSGHLALD